MYVDRCVQVTVDDETAARTAVGPLTELDLRISFTNVTAS
jgi:hypothetical protein